MCIYSEYLFRLQTESFLTFQRIGVVLYGEEKWQNELITAFNNIQHHKRWFYLGDMYLDNAQCVALKHGSRLLGQECDVLVFDARKDFDANSFMAALGALVGGGLLIVLTTSKKSVLSDELWMQRQWQKLIPLEQNNTLPALPTLMQLEPPEQFVEQKAAVDSIVKVINGHRKRPFVLTADRGRGKSSALGIACAKILADKSQRILITAPTIAAVAPVFYHAFERSDSTISHKKKGRVEVGDGYIQYVAPDELLSSKPECDLLLVDEASAIPLPMLIQITQHYHRLVFSSTIHGYEGSGRGFTLKFTQWLKNARPGMRSLHLKQPIRWADNDSLELWSYDAFVLNPELDQAPALDLPNVTLQKLTKLQLLANPDLLRICFSLLVNAHYQTSPNDLLHLLRDDKCSLYVALQQESLVGVLLTVEEGQLEQGLVEEIKLGKRRPKGHLTPITMITQLGHFDVGQLATLRIMRIAVHPSLHGQGIGQRMIAQLKLLAPAHIDYLSTSFAATQDVVSFWSQCDFSPIRLGTMRDAASGCYSLLMVCALYSRPLPWISEAHQLFDEIIRSSAGIIYPRLEPEILRALCSDSNTLGFSHSAKYNLLKIYASGGSSYESISVWLSQWLFFVGLSNVSDLMISKVILNLSWAECGYQYGLAGRKQIEAELKQQLRQQLAQFTL